MDDKSEGGKVARHEYSTDVPNFSVRVATTVLVTIYSGMATCTVQVQVPYLYIQCECCIPALYLLAAQVLWPHYSSTSTSKRCSTCTGIVQVQAPSKLYVYSTSTVQYRYMVYRYLKPVLVLYSSDSYSTTNSTRIAKTVMNYQRTPYF